MSEEEKKRAGMEYGTLKIWHLELLRREEQLLNNQAKGQQDHQGSTNEERWVGLEKRDD